MKSLAYTLGFICGILAVAVIGVIIGIIAKKANGGKEPAKYDERQEAIRGIVFKKAFYTLVIYNIAYGVFDMATGIVWCDRFTGVFIGICLALTVFAVCSIMSGAYFRIDEKPTVWVSVIAVVSLINAIISIIRIVNGEFIIDGMLSYNSVNLIVALMFLAALIAMAVKRARDKRSEETEIDE